MFSCSCRYASHDLTSSTNKQDVLLINQPKVTGQKSEAGVKALGGEVKWCKQNLYTLHHKQSSLKHYLERSCHVGFANN